MKISKGWCSAAILAVAGAIVLALMWPEFTARWKKNISRAQGMEDNSLLMVGTNVWPGYEPFFLARELGYLDGAGVRFVEYTSASQVLVAFRNGVLQAAALTLDEVLRLVSEGHNLCVILVTDVSDGADVILGKPTLQGMADLQGKRLGVENTALGAYVLARACAITGLSRDGVTVVPLEVDRHVHAYIRGDVDALVTFEPVRSKLLARGARELFSSRQMPGEIVDVLVVAEGTLAQRPDSVRRLLVAWFRALQFLRDHPNSAAEIMSERLQLPPDSVLSSLEGLTLPDLDENVSFLKGSSPALETTARRLAGLMHEAGLLEGTVDTKNLASCELLEEIKAGDAAGAQQADFGQGPKAP